MPVINICGVLVHAQPDRIADVRKRIEGETGVEVHHVAPDGRMVVTIETPSQEQTGAVLTRFQQLDHILSTALVYQYFDDDFHQELAS